MCNQPQSKWCNPAMVSNLRHVYFWYCILFICNQQRKQSLVKSVKTDAISCWNILKQSTNSRAINYLCTDVLIFLCYSGTFVQINNFQNVPFVYHFIVVNKSYWPVWTICWWQIRQVFGMKILECNIIDMYLLAV